MFFLRDIEITSGPGALFKHKSPAWVCPSGQSEQVATRGVARFSVSHCAPHVTVASLDIRDLPVERGAQITPYCPLLARGLMSFGACDAASLRYELPPVLKGTEKCGNEMEAKLRRS
jgi:hypothetical protein